MPDEIVVAEQAQATDWTAGFAPELKSYVETKGFKDPSAVTDAYRNLEKLRGVPAERLLTLPETMDAEGALDPVWARLGRPETADKYTRVLDDKFNDGVFTAVTTAAHKLGLSDGQFKGLQTIMAEQATGLQAAQETASAAAFDAWKGANPEGFANAAKVMATVGVDEAGLAGLLNGDKTELYGFLAKVAARSAEGKPIHGEQPGAEFGLTGAAAQAKIMALFQDKDFMAQYTHANMAMRKPAIERMEKLQQAAAAGKA